MLNDMQGMHPGIHQSDYPSLLLAPSKDLAEKHHICLAAEVRGHCQKQTYRISFEQKYWPAMYLWKLMEEVGERAEVMPGC